MDIDDVDTYRSDASPKRRRSRDNNRADSSKMTDNKRSYSRSPGSTSRKVYRDTPRGSGRDDRDRDRDRVRYDRNKEREPPRRNRTRSRSRSPRSSRSPKRYNAKSRNSHRRSSRSNSRSPFTSRSQPVGVPSRCLGVFGLNVNTTESEIHHIFAQYGPIKRVQVVIDANTGRSRGFCFVYFESLDDSKVAKDKCNGIKLGGKHIRVDFSITQRAHSPTPGIYMGKSSARESSRSSWNYRGGRRRERDRDDHYRDRRSSSYTKRVY